MELSINHNSVFQFLLPVSLPQKIVEAFLAEFVFIIQQVDMI